MVLFLGAVEMSTTNEPVLHVQQLSIKNFMGVTAINVDAHGRHVVFHGDNGTGKTSVLTALWQTLVKADGKNIPNPVHTGAESAESMIDIGEYVIKRRWKPDGATTIQVSHAGGGAARKDALTSLLDDYCLDPARWGEMKPRDQLNEMLRVLKIACPVETVEKITGKKHPPLPGETAYDYLARLSADTTGAYYVERRTLTGIAQQKQSALAEQKKIVERLPAPVAGVDAAAVLARMDALEKQRQERESRQAVLAKLRDRWQAAIRERDAEQVKRDRLGHEISEIEAQITELQRKLAATQGHYDRSQDALKEMVANVEQIEATCFEAAEYVKAIADPASDIAAARQELRALEANRDQSAKSQAARDQLARLESEATEATTQAEHAGTILADLRHLSDHLLDGHDIGVPGLSVGDGEPLFNGHSVKQASHAQRVIIGLRLGMLSKRRLRIVRIDAGESLGPELLATVFRLAKEEKYQVIMTKVSPEKELTVEIVDGDVAEESPAAVEAAT